MSTRCTQNTPLPRVFALAVAVVVALTFFVAGATASKASMITEVEALDWLSDFGEPELPATEPSSDTYDNGILGKVEALDWIHEPGDYTVAPLAREIQLNSRYRLVVGNDAMAYDRLVNGTTDPDIEAILESRVDRSTAYYLFSETGYVSLDDWDELDADALLASIRQSTDKTNAARREVGIPEMHVTGWRMAPTLDREQSAVYWVIEAQTEGQTFLNATAVKLGRYGYEMIIWAVDPQTYVGSRDELIGLADNITFRPGHGFADYEPGDALAGFGIASLVAVTAGAATGKSQGFLTTVKTVLLFALKKAWLGILLSVAAVGAILRRLYSKSRRQNSGRRPGRSSDARQTRRFVPTSDVTRDGPTTRRRPEPDRTNR